MERAKEQAKKIKKEEAIEVRATRRCLRRRYRSIWRTGSDQLRGMLVWELPAWRPLGPRPEQFQGQKPAGLDRVMKGSEGRSIVCEWLDH